MNGDNVKCCNCGFDGLVERGSDTCPDCGLEGALSWKENEEQEIEKGDTDMTRERRDRIEEIAEAIAGFRSELLGMRLAEIHELPSIDDTAIRLSSCDHITEIRNATDLFAEGICELGY